MPTPGAASIANAIADTPYTVEGDFPTTIRKDSTTVQLLATGMHAGWTSASPSTTTTMASTIPAAFSGVVAGNGLAFLTAIGTGIDAEVQAWASSWLPVPQTHAYTPTSASIVAAIMAAAPIDSAGARALAEKAAGAFMQFFVQEAG